MSGGHLINRSTAIWSSTVSSRRALLLFFNQTRSVVAGDQLLLIGRSSWVITGWDNRWWSQSCNSFIPSITKNNSSFTSDHRLKSAVMNDGVNRHPCGLSDAVSPRDRRCRDCRAPTSLAQVFDGEGIKGFSCFLGSIVAVCGPNLLPQRQKWWREWKKTKS